MLFRDKQTGFSLLGFLLAVAIILVMVVAYFSRSSSRATPAQTQKKAGEDIKRINDTLNQYQQQIDIQNNLNSVR